MSSEIELFDPTNSPKSALFVVAHPDDIDFGMAGTAAVLAASGTEVFYAICTSGEAGVPEDLDRRILAETRQAEQLAAASKVGVSNVMFLGLPDGALEFNLHARMTISRVIRQVRPEVVICQTPEFDYSSIFGSHPDHIAAAQATVAAFYPDSRNPHSHPMLLLEGLPPHSASELWIFRSPMSNLVVDISDHIEQKIEALSCHESQIENIDEVADMLREWSRQTARDYGVTSKASMVEAFQRFKI